MHVERVAGTLHKLTFSLLDQPDAATVNSAASVGPDGILLVDAGWTQTAERLSKKLTELSHGNVKLIIVTHPHLDHFGGVSIFRDRAALIAHENAEGELYGRYFALGDLPEREMPLIQVEDELSLRFNGEEIRIISAPGHTHSDMIVWFVSLGVALLGDLVLSDKYPPLDLARGGDAEQYISSLQDLVDLFPSDVKLITGHGRDYSLDDLREHLRMTVATLDLIKRGMAEGKSAQNMVDEAILKDWERWDSSLVSSETWITQAHESLSGQVRRSISEPLSNTILEKGVEAALEQYRELKDSQPDSYLFTEGELNMLGYQLLWRDMSEAAIAVFKQNIEAFPSSPNPYDSLGEAFAATGARELAIECYEKALEFDPNYPSAAEALRNLKAVGKE